MQIVINVPGELACEGFERPFTEEEKNILIKAIGNGTPLPKGHGRIADMDEAIKCIEDVEGKDAIWAISLIEWACGKRTIIEADKAESEDEYV